MSDYTLIQSGDPNAAENVGALAGRPSSGDRLLEGLDVTAIDYSTPTVDIAGGKTAHLLETATAEWTDDSGGQHAETVHQVLVICHLDPQTGISLTADAVNHVYVDPQWDTDDSPQIVVNTTGTSPSPTALKVHEIDTGAHRTREQWYLERADGTLTFPDGDAVQTVFSEISDGVQLYDRRNERYHLAGATFGSVGHDDIDLPQSVKLTVADFEQGTLPTSFDGDGGSFSVQSSIVKDGNYSLRGHTPDGSKKSVMSSGLSSQPQAGDVFEVAFYLTSSTDEPQIRFGSKYEYTASTNNNKLQLYDISAGAFVDGADVDWSRYLNEWLTLRTYWGLDNSVEFELYDSASSVVSTGSGNLAGQKSGDVQFAVQTTDGTSSSQYFDSFTITRRTLGYLTETKKGTTQLGNEVTPTGTINTGAIEAPLNALRGTFNRAPVNDSATQGDESILTLLASSQSPAVMLRRILDGQGGAYGHQLDGALGRFARLCANLSWEHDSLSDVPNWSSGDDGVSTWTFNVNGRPRRIHVEHDGSGGSDDRGGVVASALTTYQSLGGFRITFHDVSYTDNGTDNFLAIGVSNQGVTASAWNTGDGFLYVNQLLQTVNGGVSGSDSVTIDWSSNHDISLEYDGTEVRLLVDGELVASRAYSTNADFSPIIQLKEATSSASAETVEAEQVTVEPLPEVLQ